MKDGDGLPEGWGRVSIGEIAQVNPRSNEIELDDDVLVSFVPMAAVTEETGQVDVSRERRLAEVKRGYTSFRDGDVLFAKITPCMENGKSAVVRGLAAGIGFGSTEFHVLRAAAGINADLLRYYVAQQSFRSAARTCMTGTAGQLRVPAAYLAEVPYPIAPAAEQRRIVEAIEQQFTRLDAGVAALKRTQAALKRYRAAVLKAAVEGQLTAAWRAEHPDVEPASALLRRILAERRAKWEADVRAKGKDPANIRYDAPEAPDTTNLPELPEGWCWASLAQCSHRITDGTHQPPQFVDEGIPFVFVQHIVGGAISFENTKFISQETFNDLNARCPVEVGDILYSAVGSYGVAVPVCTLLPFSFQRHIAHLKLSKSLSQGYFVHCLNSPWCLSQAHRAARGVAQKTVTLGDLTRYVVPIPPLAEQEQIVAEVEQRLSIVSELEVTVEANRKRAERLRQSILERAFAGKLVPQNPDDEPANALLERIQEQREGLSSNGRNSHREAAITTQATLWDKE